MIPILAAAVLLFSGVLRLADAQSWVAVEPAQSLLAGLSERMAAGQAQGYVEVLRSLVSGRVVSAQLTDRAGELIATYPAPLTRSNVGIFATPLQATRSFVLESISSARVFPLEADGVAVGELRLLRVPGLSAGGWWGLLLSALGAWALILGFRPSSSTANPALTHRTTQSQSPMLRLGARLGAALNHADLGVLLLDSRLQVRYLNAAGGHLCGLDGRSALNQPVYSVIKLEGDENPFQLEGAEAFSESRVLHIRGRVSQPLQATVLRLQNRSGEWSGMLILLSQAPMGPDEELLQQAALAQQTLEALPDGVAITDRYGRVQRVNSKLNRLFDYADGELLGMGISKLLPVPFLNEPDVSLATYLGDEGEGRPRVVGWRKNATTFPVDLRVQVLGAGNLHYLLLIADSGARERHDSLSMRLGRLLDYAAEEIYIFDAHSLYFTEANREARDNLGLTLEQLGRMTPLHLAPNLDRDQLEHDLASLRRSDSRQVTYRTEHRRADGSTYPVSLRISYSPDEDPPVFMALAQDISDQRATEARLERMALSDQLTSLPNRAALRAHLQGLLLDAGRTDIAVLFLDLNRFKQINDTHGHAVGDEVLIELARRLSEQLSEGHYLARLSGDEFVLVIDGGVAMAAEQTAQRLVEALKVPMQTSAGPVEVGICIGIAHRQSGEGSSELMERADKAMYEAKAKGISGYVIAANF